MPRLVHDRITWLSYLQLGLWGFFLYGFGPVVPLLRDEQGTSAAVAGLHSTGLAVGAILGGLLFPRLSRRLGRGRATWWSLVGVAAGVLALCLFHPLPATLTTIIVLGTCGTILINGVNATLAEHHRGAAPAAISEANAVCAGMGIVAPVFIGYTVGAGLGWRPAIAVEVVLIGAVALVAIAFRVRLPQGDAARARSRVRPAVVAAPSRSTAARRPDQPLPRAYWMAWLLMAVTGSVEVCLSLWTADVLRSHAGMSPGDASGALAAIVTGMFLGRLAGGRVALRVRPVPLLFSALAVSLAGFAVFWVAPIGWLAVSGLVVLGLGNAMHYPLGISIALAVAGGQADRAAAYSSYAMAVGFGVAPVVLGRVADGVGPHRAFLLLPVLVLVAALLTRWLRDAATPPAAGAGPPSAATAGAGALAAEDTRPEPAAASATAATVAGSVGAVGSGGAAGGLCGVSGGEPG